jgi:hypothetical protein
MYKISKHLKGDDKSHKEFLMEHQLKDQSQTHMQELMPSSQSPWSHGQTITHSGKPTNGH